jgi:hypothetical protein
MSQPHHRLLLEPLSRSPSPSGSLSSSASFDPHLIDQPRTPAGPSSYAQPEAVRPTLGLRELASMAYSDRQARKARKDSSGDTTYTYAVSHSLPGSTRGSLDVPRRPIEMRRGNSEDGGVGAFAREVVITGHKVVGGKTWTDKARMGAYVGGFELRSQPLSTKSTEPVLRRSVYEIEITTRSVSYGVGVWEFATGQEELAVLIYRCHRREGRSIFYGDTLILCDFVTRSSRRIRYVKLTARFRRGGLL